MRFGNAMQRSPSTNRNGEGWRVAPSIAWHAAELELWTYTVHNTWKQDMSCKLPVSWPRSSRLQTSFSVLSSSEMRNWLELALFFMPLFSFLIYLLCYRSCQYVIVLEIYGYNMHLVLIVACLTFFFFLYVSFLVIPF